MEYKISVIIPVYNGERYINGCLESLNKQTLDNIEIIFVNDGSTDQTRDILKKISNSRDNIKVINQNNSGPGKARNEGIRIAKGEYIKFLDVDDVQDREMLQKMYKMIEETNSDVVVCGIKEVSKEGTQYRLLEFDTGTVLESNEIKEFILKKVIRNGGGIFASSVNKMYKRSFIQGNNIFFDEERIYGEDWFFNQRVLGKCKKMTFVNEPLYIYMRINNNSIMYSYHNNLFQLHLRSRKFIRERMEEWGTNSKEDIKNWNMRFCEKVIESIENEMSNRNLVRLSKKIENIKLIVNNDEVKLAIKENHQGVLRKMIFKQNYLILSIWVYYRSVIRVNLSKIKNNLRELIGIGGFGKNEEI